MAQSNWLKYRNVKIFRSGKWRNGEINVEGNNQLMWRGGVIGEMAKMKMKNAMAKTAWRHGEKSMGESEINQSMA
jgi:hypothetical protein